jgi:serine protease Do
MGRLFRSGLGWALVAGVAVGALGTVLFFNSKRFALAAPSELPALTAAETDVLATLDSAVTKLTERLVPSVVHIRNPRGSEGSGVVFRGDGWIVSNAHVVEGASQVKVTFNDGRTADGKVYLDDMSDIAVVKVDRTGLEPAHFADSELVKPGQIAIAIGSPLGFEQSVTFGHVSATGRTTNNPAAVYALGRPYFDMIQTDAAINPGNSGGPLMNSRGEVIGINTYIASSNGLSAGVGFAIQSNTVKVVAEQLISTGKVTRGYVGLIPANLLGYEKQEKNVQSGAIIREVSPDSPASKAGLKAGDVVTELNSIPIRGEMDFRNAMILNKPGANVTLKVIRDGKPLTIDVKLAERPAEPAPTTRNQRRGGENPLGDLPDGFDIPMPFDRVPNAPRNSGPQTEQPAKLGVEVRALTPDEQKALPVKGVFVASVQPGSPAERAGVKPGMIITRIDSRTIESPADLTDAMKQYHAGDTALLTFGKYQKNMQSIMTITIQF